MYYHNSLFCIFDVIFCRFNAYFCFQDIIVNGYAYLNNKYS